MSEASSSARILPFVHPRTKQIETEDVLTILRAVSQHAASPVVRECLHEVCAEIAYLTSSDGTFEEHLAREEQGVDPNDEERDAI